VLERRGAVLRVFDAGDMPEALCALARDFRLSRVYPDLRRLTVKDYPPGAAELLTGAGFSRQMNEFVLYRGGA
jgi:ATP-dependent Lhr-like helicase